MSSTNLYTLIAEFPEEQDAVERLIRCVGEARDHHLGLETHENSRDEREWTIQRLFDIAHPSSQRVLARILMRLVEVGILRQTVRVESVASGGIGDFESITEIPSTLFDEHVGHDVEVDMDRVSLIYKAYQTIE